MQKLQHHPFTFSKCFSSSVMVRPTKVLLKDLKITQDVELKIQDWDIFTLLHLCRPMFSVKLPICKRAMVVCHLT